MQFLYSLSLLFCFFAINKAAEVRLIDLDPADAQQIIEKQDTTLKYAPKVDSNVPAVRYLGNEPHNVLEDIYLANQYHGQDGVGGYLYGYSVPDIAKTERKKAGGDLKGAYNYISGGQEIKVQYWDDGTGFHQIDNVPKILPKQIDDTPEVKAAKEEHARIWQEQAERNSHPIADPYNSAGQYASGPLSAQGQIQRQQQFAQQPQYHGQPQGQYQGQPQGQLQGQYQGQYSQPQAQFTQGPQQQAGQQGQYSQPQAQFSQAPQPPQGQNYQPQPSQNVNQYQQKPQLAQTQDHNDIYSGQYTENRNSYAQNRPAQGQHQQGQYQQGQKGQYQQGQQGHQGQQGQYQEGQDEGQYQEGQDEGQYHEEEGVTGPPKGFFYSFDYPVGIIVSKDGGSIQKREGDVKGIYAEGKANFETQLKQGGGYGGSYHVQQ